ncbi:NAD(P)-binding domain-containing protein, partial [Ancylobacter radicis]
MAKVGFVGLGIMGAPMAGHLIDAGHELYLYDIKPVPAELTGKGGVACATGTDVAKNADIIITMVPDTPHVAAALFGENGVAAG